MRQLFPTPIDTVDPLDLHLGDARPAHADRPWVMCNMIASVDGATAVEGRSGGLGGPADKLVFRALRASCDWVVAASATAVAERYRVPTSTEAVAERRRAQGRGAAPRLAIVTASGAIDPTIPAFTARHATDAPPLVITGADAPSALLDALDAEIVRMPTARPEPHGILELLHAQGASVVLAEGGPTFNGMLHDAGVIDEFCLSVSPLLAGGASDRIVAHAANDRAAPLRLSRLLEADGMLFARYLRA